MLERVRNAWDNAYYRWYGVYVSVLVTLIFGFQMYRYFVSVPASDVSCPSRGAFATSVSLIGGLLYG